MSSNQPNLEIRTWAQPVQFRKANDHSTYPYGGTLGGYAAVYNRMSQDLGGFVEQVEPGAFTKSLADGVPVLARYNHTAMLASTEAETLRLSSDGIGLAYELDLPDTSTGRDVAVLAERGDLRYSSFAFYTIDDYWTTTPSGYPQRNLRAVQLVDVAPVDSPAYRDSSVGLRSLSELIGRDAAGMDPREVGRMIAVPTVEEIEELRAGQVDNHPNRDFLAAMIAAHLAA